MRGCSCSAVSFFVSAIIWSDVSILTTGWTHCSFRIFSDTRAFCACTTTRASLRRYDVVKRSGYFFNLVDSHCPPHPHSLPFSHCFTPNRSEMVLRLPNSPEITQALGKKFYSGCFATFILIPAPKMLSLTQACSTLVDVGLITVPLF